MGTTTNPGGGGRGLAGTAFIQGALERTAITARLILSSTSNKRGAATSWCLFLRYVGQVIGAACFGAVLNETVADRMPAVHHLMDRVLDPGARQALAELANVVAAGLHHAYPLGCAFAAGVLVLVLFLPARVSSAQRRSQ